MKHNLLNHISRFLLLACLLIGGISYAWGTETTLYDITFKGKTIENITTTESNATFVSKEYDGYTVYIGIKSDKSMKLTENGLEFTNNNLNNYQCLTLPLTVQKNETITVKVTLADETKIKYSFKDGELPNTPNNGSTGTTYGTNSKTNTFTYVPTTEKVVLYLGRSGSNSGKTIESIKITQEVKITTHTVTFNKNDGSDPAVTYVQSNIPDKTKTALNSIQAIGWTRDGYTFAGWAETGEGEVAYADGAEITLTANKTLYAKWTPIAPTTKTIYLKPYEGWGGNAYIYNATASSFINNPMTKGSDCYADYFIAEVPSSCNSIVFVKQGSWSGQAADQTIDFDCSTNDLFVMAAQDWTEGNPNWGKFTGSGSTFALPKYMITINDNGADGGEAMSNITNIECGGSATLPKMTRTKTNYTFAGWKNGDDEFEDEATINDIRGSFTITAQWTPVDKWYIKGSWDEWVNAHDIVDGKVTIENLTATNYTFKVVHRVGNAETWWGLYESTSYMTRGNCTSWNLNISGNDGKDCGLTADMAGNYNFAVNTSGDYPVVSVTYPRSLEFVSEAIIWDFSKAADGETALPGGNEWVVLSSITGVKNDANFNSQALAAKGAGYVYRSNTYKCYQGKNIKFKTTIPGAVVINGCNPTKASTITFQYRNADTGDYTAIKSVTAPNDKASSVEDLPAFIVKPGDIEINIDGGNARIYKITFTPAVSVSTAQYATFYHATYSYIMPEGLEGITVEGVSGTTLALNNTHYAAGSVVPAGEALILHATSTLEAPTNFILYAGNASSDVIAANMLKGTSTAEEETTGGAPYYRLSQHENKIGFYYGAADGVAFKPGANKAYLALNGASAPDRFVFNPSSPIVTGVDEVLNKYVKSAKSLINGKLYIVRENKVFDLNGRLVK